jgi:hypothetical protein
MAWQLLASDPPGISEMVPAPDGAAAAVGFFARLLCTPVVRAVSPAKYRGVVMRREAALRLIRERYESVHGADPELSYDHLIVLGRAERVGATCGYRRASAGFLFLEHYLDRPIEQAVADVYGRAISRADIVEIGNLAAGTAPAMVALWAKAANDLSDETEIAVAVLTAPLRRMFARLGIALAEIAPASAQRLGPMAARWGRYYALDPIVCAGRIADGQEKLARFASREPRPC